jgi:hypothetical protein
MHGEKKLRGAADGVENREATAKKQRLNSQETAAYAARTLGILGDMRFRVADNSNGKQQKQPG